MIKLFRKKRYNLMEHNKTSKYLIYAIGEIVLVMIGILLALQVNNWNENRKTHQNEIKLVKQLLDDAKADSVFFESRIMHQQNRDVLFNQLIIASENKATDSLLNLKVTEDPFFFRLAYQSNLISNNPEAYDLISDDSLKSKLRAYKAVYDYVVHSIELNNRISEQYGIPLQIKYYNNLSKLPDQQIISDLSFAYYDLETVAKFAILKDYGINYYVQVDNFLKINNELIIQLKAYINTNQ